MDKHVEECICYVESCCPWMGDCTCQCICDILRACEKRMLDAAREAVDFVTVFIADVGEKGKPDLRQMIHVGSALTAIDALKEDNND